MMEIVKPPRIDTAGALHLADIRICLGEDVLLAIDTVVMPGDVLTVMGPSGSGKSTLMAYIAGFLDPSFRASGRAILDGVDLTDLAPEDRQVGLLFQDPMLFPHLSVGGNLLFALDKHAPDRAAQVRDGLAALGLSGFEDRDVATLSGGQAARVALLRLLLSHPRAALLDEPFAKLDARRRDETRRLVFDRLRAAGLPAVLVTHDPADAAAAGGSIVHVGD